MAERALTEHDRETLRMAVNMSPAHELPGNLDRIVARIAAEHHAQGVADTRAADRAADVEWPADLPQRVRNEGAADDRAKFAAARLSNQWDATRDGVLGPGLRQAANDLRAALADLPAVPETPKKTTGPGWFWTQDEWAEWSNRLAALIPENDMAGNPDGAQESIIEATLAMYARDRAAAQPVEPARPDGGSVDEHDPATCPDGHEELDR